MVDQPEFRKALEFYVDLVRDAGETDAAERELQPVPGAVPGRQGRDVVRRDGRRWPARGRRQPGQGQERLCPRPGRADEGVGMALVAGRWRSRPRRRPDLAWRYIAWATGPQYIREAGTQIAGGWAAIPPGTRRSTYEIPQYQKAARAFAQPTLDAHRAAPVDNPGTTKRPGNPGVQYVGIPQFQDVGNQCTEQFARRDRRRGEGHRCVESMSEHRVEGDQIVGS